MADECAGAAAGSRATRGGRACCREALAPRDGCARTGRRAAHRRRHLETRRTAGAQVSRCRYIRRMSGRRWSLVSRRTSRTSELSAPAVASLERAAAEELQHEREEWKRQLQAALGELERLRRLTLEGGQRLRELTGILRSETADAPELSGEQPCTPLCLRRIVLSSLLTDGH